MSEKRKYQIYNGANGVGHCVVIDPAKLPPREGGWVWASEKEWGPDDKPIGASVAGINAAIEQDGFYLSSW